ncbi:MAG: cell envelope integrity protein CreD [Gammaproteobacteria bacterium]|nr:cell envelope integrity protein CreD [Gammaproteobacteria bacterium]
MDTSMLFVRNRATLKLLFVGLLSLSMLVPLSMIGSVVRDRQTLQTKAENTIANRWGGVQTIGGLVALLQRPVMLTDARQSRTQTAWSARVLTDLEVTADLVTEHRYLGIYEAPVYTARLAISGLIDWTLLEQLQPEGDLVFWLPLSDVRGVRQVSALTLDGLKIDAMPLSTHSDRISGLQFTIAAKDRKHRSADARYLLELQLVGSGSLQFLPMADTTQVDLAADWPHPEFIGQFLPAERSVADAGTRARWQLLGLNRPYGDQWPVADMSFDQLRDAAFGMRLETPVDGYQRSERSVKYGFLFITLTFFTLFLFEVMTGRPLHPVPYVLTGAALAVFYLVLLALSEYLPFAGAFTVAAGLLVGIVTPYMVAVLHERRNGYRVGLMMALTYGLLYVLVTAQHAALLLGSLALLLAIAALMFLTRDVDWYGYGGDE